MVITVPGAGNGRRAAMRRLGAFAVIALSMLAAATPAAASDVTTNCANLQAALTAAATNDTITLTQLCTKGNSGAAMGKFTLPVGKSITLQGQPGSGAGFDGSGVGARPLTGSNVGSTVVRDLVFENAHGAPGGALSLAGTAPIVDHDTFLNNNSVNLGGALYLEAFPFGVATGPWKVTNSVFRDNTAAIAGGAGSIAATVTTGADQPVVLSGNQFVGNQVSGGGSGGALSLFFGSTVAARPLVQTGNVFDANRVVAATSDVSGGAETEFGFAFDSTGDRFTGNQIQLPSGGHDAEGGALSLETCDASQPAAQITDGVIAGNAITGGGGAHAHGAGIYVGCALKPVTLNLRDTTVAGNDGGGSGATAGIFGGAADKLALTNTIDAGNAGGSDLTGFTTVSASFSDACAGVAALPGPGNLCADPALAAPGAPAADVHQTASSPTIDKGANALVPAGLSTDFEGKPRIVDGLATGAATVDIGADERTAPAPPSGAGGSSTSTSSATATTAPPLGVIPAPGAASFRLAKIKAERGGVITLSLEASTSGRFDAIASTSTKAKRASAARTKRPKRRALSYARGSATAAAAGALKLTLAPSRVARRALKRSKRLTVRVGISFAPAADGVTSSQSARVTARASKPRKHRR